MANYENNDEPVDPAVRYANWALMGNDALYPHQIPETLRELHKRIVQALRQHSEEAIKKHKCVHQLAEEFSKETTSDY